MKPSRGEIWMADLEPTAGHEQGGKRPCLVLSDDTFNQGPAELVVVLPITSRQRDVPIRVAILPPEGGLKVESFVMPEMVRSISTLRLFRRMGRLAPKTLATVENHIRILLGL
jgi:mRNA interferase MazF